MTKKVKSPEYLARPKWAVTLTALDADGKEIAGTAITYKPVRGWTRVDAAKAWWKIMRNDGRLNQWFHASICWKRERRKVEEKKEEAQ